MSYFHDFHNLRQTFQDGEEYEFRKLREYTFNIKKKEDSKEVQSNSGAGSRDAQLRVSSDPLARLRVRMCCSCMHKR